MPISVYLSLIFGVLLAAGLTVAAIVAFGGAGAIGAILPVTALAALVLHLGRR